MKKINRGSIVKDSKGREVYRKYIDYNRAVLWKTRELSVSPVAINPHLDSIAGLVFIDRDRRKMYSIPINKFREVATLKKMHQEEQYYFPIEALTVSIMDRGVK